MSKICTKTINKIQEEQCRFFIPNYQRGYRWTKQQVDDLLNDLLDFDQQNPPPKTFYCLQPIVVKQLDKESGIVWEVIDGQQRLTTIYILLSYLHEMMPMVKIFFSIDYETRSGSREYLKNISQNAASNITDENIDYFHMKNAYCYISSWFEKLGVESANTIASIYNRLSTQTRVIWYEPDPSLESVDIFTRINVGKIPLTNAELIKALFLRKDNFFDSELGVFNPQKQLEIAGEWDRIEYALQNDQMWYFLTDGSASYDTRIDFLFDILADQKNRKDIIGMQLHPSHTLHFSFVVFSNYLEHYKNDDNCTTYLDAIKNLWLEIKQLFMTFEEWFSTQEWYHYVGYLVCTGFNVKDIWLSSLGLTKSVMRKKLQDTIAETIAFDGDLESLSCETNSIEIRRILLLFNIESLQLGSNSNVRFEFDRYKKEKWDLEHIHSLQSEEIPVKQRSEWLQALVDGMPNRMLQQKAENILRKENYSDEEFSNFYIEAVKTYGEDNEGEGINGLENLTLLDAGTNRGYKNAIFPVKRHFIIERDKVGIFIPLCTKNVFLKYYSCKVGDMLRWSKKDRNDYLNEIKCVLKPYLESEEFINE